MRTHRNTLMLVICALALLAAGCGSDGGSNNSGAATTAEAGGASSKREVISAAEVEDAPQATPERAVLEWWRDVQMNEPETAMAHYSEPPDLPDLAGQFNYVSGRLAGSVEVAATDDRGDHTVVDVRWTKPDGEIRPVTLRMSQVEGDWKLLDARFLDEMVARLQAEGVE